MSAETQDNIAWHVGALNSTIAVILQFVIRNNLFGYCSIPGTELSNPRNFLSDRSNKGVLMLITSPFNRNLMLMAPKDRDQLTGEPTMFQPNLEGWNFQSDVESIANGQ